MPWQVAGGTARLSGGSDLESFEERPEVEARMRESEVALPAPALGLENAPPVSKTVGLPVAAPLNFEGIVSLSRQGRERQGGRCKYK